VNTPVRYGSRYGVSPSPDGRGCLVCGTPLPTARAQYCSPGCKQRAYRLRHDNALAAERGAVTADLKRRQRLVAQTIYECPECGERFLAEQRCPDCNRFCRALGLGGACPHCDQPILVAELLGE
jgi:Zn finger protein HypA/HybF involved in hydrogenase expression